MHIARSRLGRRVGGIAEMSVAGKRLVHCTFTSGKKSGAVVSRDDVGGESHCCELTSTESSDNFKTHELLCVL